MIQPLQKISATTGRLSTYISGALAQPLPQAVIEKARQHILDTVAAMISGTHLRPGQLAIAYAKNSVARARHPSSERRSSPLHITAALANGMLAHADETDDSHAPSRTHPGCAVIPSALAVAESMHATGEHLLKAVVLGYDVAARMNYALGPEDFAATSRSTHSFGGTFGAGAAAGALLRLDELQARHLLSFCAQQASGVGCSVRDSEHIEKAFDFGGMPARNGVTAATMAAAGFTGVDDVFSGERNFFEAYGPPGAHPERLCEALGQRFEILDTNIKKWPVGSPAQSALDALTALMQEERIGPGDIEAIRGPFADALGPHRRQCADARVNVQQLLAMLLIDGELSFNTIHDRDGCRMLKFWRCGGRLQSFPAKS